MARQPLCEVFGYPIDNVSPEAAKVRTARVCPFSDGSSPCRKDKVRSPLGVCSVYGSGQVAITCPSRFKQNSIIVRDAASFFFGPQAQYACLREVKLRDKNGKCKGNIDMVLVSFDAQGEIRDFGALEIQGVYISGNVRMPFEYYMANPQARTAMDWSKEPNYPKPDYLSSSRKRLAPQLLVKGGIFKAWAKRIAVAIDKSFFSTLPTLEKVDPASADIAWLVYDLKLDSEKKIYTLVNHEIVYTKFSESMEKIYGLELGDVSDFVKELKKKMGNSLAAHLSPKRD